MPYSKSLAARIRQITGSKPGITEKQMFGGLAFLMSGNMLVCVWHHSLIARVGADQAEALLGREFVRPFDVTGRPMKGWLMVEPDGLDTDAQLAEWIDRAEAFVATLPPK